MIRAFRAPLWLLLGLLLATAWGASALRAQQAPAGEVAGLLETLRQSVGLEGDIVRALDAREALAERGRLDRQGVVPLLVEQLRAPRAQDKTAWAYRIALIGVLEDIGVAAEGAVPILVEITEDPEERNGHVKAAAERALLAIGTPAAEDAVRRAAVQTVESWLQTASPAEVEQAVAQHGFLIRQELRNREMSETVIKASVVSLLVIGEAARPMAPLLQQAYGDPRVGTELRSLLAEALRAMGVEELPSAAETPPPADDPIAAIIADSRSDDELISGLAMIELGRLGPSERVIDVLIEALREGRNPGSAANALGTFGAAAERAAPYLLPYLEERHVGANAVQALGRIGATDPEIVTALERVAADAGSPHRALAASALGELGSVSSLPVLIAALDASDKYLRILAAKAIGEFGEEARPAVAPLAALLEDPDRDVRRSAVVALGRIGPAAAPAVPLISRQLQSADQRLKESARLTLERIGGDAAAAVLRADAERYAAADRAEYLRLREGDDAQPLYRFLRQLPEARAVPVARLMLRDPDAMIAYGGSAVLIRAGLEAETVPVLADMVASGTLEGELGGRMGWDWLHNADGALFQRMTGRIRDYLAANIGRYPEEQQARVRRYLDAATGGE